MSVGQTRLPEDYRPFEASWLGCEPQASGEDTATGRAEDTDKAAEEMSASTRVNSRAAGQSVTSVGSTDGSCAKHKAGIFLNIDRSEGALG